MKPCQLPTPKPRRKYVKLSPVQWAEARAAYAAGGVTVEDLAARYGVNVRTLFAHMARHAVTKGCAAAALAGAVETKILNEALLDGDDLGRRICESRDRVYQDAERLQALAMAQVQALQDPATALGASAALRSLDLAASILNRIQRARWVSLGMDGNTPPPGDLPELPIRELTQTETAEIVERLRQEDDRLGYGPDTDVTADDDGDVVTEGDDDDAAEDQGEENRGDDWGGGNDAPAPARSGKSVVAK